MPLRLAIGAASLLLSDEGGDLARKPPVVVPIGSGMLDAGNGPRFGSCFLVQQGGDTLHHRLVHGYGLHSFGRCEPSFDLVSDARQLRQAQLPVMLTRIFRRPLRLGLAQVICGTAEAGNGPQEVGVKGPSLGMLLHVGGMIGAIAAMLGAAALALFLVLADAHPAPTWLLAQIHLTGLHTLGGGRVLVTKRVGHPLRVARAVGEGRDAAGRAKYLPRGGAHVRHALIREPTGALRDACHFGSPVSM